MGDVKVELTNINPKFKEQLDKEYRPRFAQYESDNGMPMAELATLLIREPTIGRDHKGDVLYELKRADADGNQRISYDEFVRFLSKPNGFLSRSLTRRMATRAMRLVAPNRVIHQRAYDRPSSEKSYVDEFDCRPPPIFILLITIVEVAVFTWYVYLYNDPKDDPYSWNTGVPHASPLVYCPSRRYEIWRFLGYMLLHQGYLHLVSNCIVQLFLGIPLELVHKWWRVGIIYFLGVIGGSLGQSLFDRWTPLVGASGGGYALIGAHFANIIRNWNEMMEGWNKDIINFLGSPVFQLPVLIILAGMDTANAVYKRFADTGATTKVGISAHLAGLLVGAIIGYIFLKDLKTTLCEKIFAVIAAIMYIGLLVGAIVFNLWGSDIMGNPYFYPPVDNRTCCPRC